MSTDPNQPTGLPTPDPAAGQAAEAQAEDQRDQAEAGLTGGSLTLADVFEQGANQGPGVPHMHVKAALMALPHIDEVRADEILTATGVDGAHHVDQLGEKQRSALITAADRYAPGQEGTGAAPTGA